MAAATLWDQAKTSAYNKLSETLTGRPTPGSTAAIQASTEQALARRRLADAQRGPQSKGIDELLREYEAVSQLESANRRQAAEDQLRLTGASSLLDARGVMSQQNIIARDAAARNEREQLALAGRVNKDLLTTKAEANTTLLNPVLANERYLVDADSGDLEKYLSYGQGQTRQILEAQNRAQTMDMFTRMIGGIAMAVASAA